MFNRKYTCCYCKKRLTISCLTGNALCQVFFCLANLNAVCEKNNYPMPMAQE